MRMKCIQANEIGSFGITEPPLRGPPEDELRIRVEGGAGRKFTEGKNRQKIGGV